MESISWPLENVIMILIRTQSQRPQTQDPKVEKENPRLWLFPQGHWTLLFLFSCFSRKVTMKYFFQILLTCFYKQSHWLGFSLFSSSLHSYSKTWAGLSRRNIIQTGFLVILPGLPRPFWVQFWWFGLETAKASQQQRWQRPPVRFAFQFKV